MTFGGSASTHYYMIDKNNTEHKDNNSQKSLEHSLTLRSGSQSVQSLIETHLKLKE